MLEPVEVTLRADPPQVTHIGGGNLAAPASAAGEPEAEQGTVAQAFKTIVAGGQHRLQLSQGDGGLLARPHATLDRRASGAAEHGADGRLLAGVGHLFEPVRRG